MSRFKDHWEEHKEKYYIGAIGILVVTSAALYLNNRTSSRDSAKSIAQNVGLINWKPTALSEAVVVPQGHPGYVIQNNDTGEIFMSQNKAAKHYGISPTILSQHLNGKMEDVSGMSFTRLGIANHSQE